MVTFGFIGCGNMGGALIRALCAVTAPAQVKITDLAKEKAEQLAKETGASFAEKEDIAAHCDYIFLGVKPQGMQTLSEEIRGTLEKRTDRFVLVTMAAGIAMEKLCGWFGDYPVIRIMPNLPVSVGEGMILWCTQNTTEDETAVFADAMRGAGKLLRIDEGRIDAGSAVSGCGPAYAFLFLEALADGGVRCGLSRADAMQLAAQTLAGSAEMVLKTGRHPGELKDAVCSPGGTTIEGVLALEEGAFRSDTAKAVIAAYEKTRKL